MTLNVPDDPVAPGSPASAQSKIKIGVVFVHGVGDQPRSATLRENVRPLFRYLRDWHRQRGYLVPPRLVASRLSYGEERQDPPVVHIEVPEYRNDGTNPPFKDFERQSWVLTEAWWAGRLEPPRLSVLMAWARSAVASVVLGVAAMVATRPPQITRRRRRGSRADLLIRSILVFNGLLLAGFYLLLVLLALPVLIALFILAALPIPGIEGFVVFRLLRPLLIEGIGDYHVYVHDDVQALHIRSAVSSTITWLWEREACDRIVVVAHSGGAVVAYDALTSDGGWPRCLPENKAFRKVDVLLTFGSALGRARRDMPSPSSLELFGQLCPQIRWFDVWAAYDPVTEGGLLAPTPDTGAKLSGHLPRASFEVANAFELLQDHGGYFDNREEFTPILAAAIEDPSGIEQIPETHFAASRFLFQRDFNWVLRHEDRLITLAAWRTVAISFFAVALLFRLWDGGLFADGAVIVRTVVGAPIIGEIARPLVDAAGALGGMTPVQVYAGAVAWLAAFAFAYSLLMKMAFDPWARRESELSAGPEAPRRGQRHVIAGRTAVVVPVLSCMALVAGLIGRIGNAGGDLVLAAIAPAALGICWIIFALWDAREQATEERRVIARLLAKSADATSTPGERG